VQHSHAALELGLHLGKGDPRPEVTRAKAFLAQR
jgi:hypothetical protein